MYDQRLFNQSSGLAHGFADEEDYDVFDKPLFQDRSNVSLYKGIKKTGEEDRPTRSKPVEFEKSNDIFGMDMFLTDNI